jgi:hypothetical protein
MMNTHINNISCIALFLMVSNATCFADKAEKQGSEESVSAAEQILGKWVQYRDTKQGRIKIIKDHRGDHTILKVYGPNGESLYSHRSEYVVEETESIYVFRYRNKVVMTGPKAGEKDPKESAYIFRIEGDRFLELHGMLRTDQGKPSLVTWERLKEEDKPNPRLDQTTA